MRRYWTDEEDSILKEIYPISGIKPCMELTGRTKDSIKCRARKLGIKANNSPTKRKSQEDYETEVPNDLEVLDTYIDNNTPIRHRHIVCGNIWKTRPRNILSGYKCPKCSNTGFNPDQKAYLYIIKFEDLDIYKVGITNNLNRRLSSFGHKATLIHSVLFDEGTKARELEVYLLNKYKKSLYNSGALTSGNTETLMLEDSDITSIISYISNRSKNI